jgi:serine protease Do
VLRLELPEGSRPLIAAPLGDSSTLQVGQFVLALGSPLGLSRSVSVGVVSSVDRYLPEEQLPGERITGALNNWIQTDAAINPGNSGGPLVDLHGRVVGINARAVHVFGENIGFAIPVNVAKEVSRAILQEGEVRRSWLGVAWQPTKSLGQRWEERDGVVVGGIFPESPAEQAGLRPGDVVVGMDGESVRVRFEEELPAFRKRISRLPEGSPVRLTILRGSKSRTVRLRAETMPETESEELELEAWGLTARTITRETARRHRLESLVGVLVSGVLSDGPADQAGLRPGDILRLLGEAEVKDLERLRELYGDVLASRAERVYMEVRRGRTTHFFVLVPDYEE